MWRLGCFESLPDFLLLLFVWVHYECLCGTMFMNNKTSTSRLTRHFKTGKKEWSPLVSRVSRGFPLVNRRTAPQTTISAHLLPCLTSTHSHALIFFCISATARGCRTKNQVRIMIMYVRFNITYLCRFSPQDGIIWRSLLAIRTWS